MNGAGQPAGSRVRVKQGLKNKDRDPLQQVGSRDRSPQKSEDFNEEDAEEDPEPEYDESGQVIELTEEEKRKRQRMRRMKEMQEKAKNSVPQSQDGGGDTSQLQRNSSGLPDDSFEQDEEFKKLPLEE